MTGPSVSREQSEAVKTSNLSNVSVRFPVKRISLFVALLATVAMLSACRFFGGEEATRTPIPTYTPTPILVVLPAGAVPAEGTPQPEQAVEPQVVAQAPTTQQQQPVEPTATHTPLPTSTPTLPPTTTPTPTLEPTLTPTLTPTPTLAPDYPFELETAEQFPAEGLAPGIVRIYAYVYEPDRLGLPDYGLRIIHNGALLDSESLSREGLPDVTRSEPGPYTRFTNLSIIIVEADPGDWIVQLVDDADQPVGPLTRFTLDADDGARELYVRYRLDNE